MKTFNFKFSITAGSKDTQVDENTPLEPLSVTKCLLNFCISDVSNNGSRVIE